MRSVCGPAICMYIVSTRARTQAVRQSNKSAITSTIVYQYQLNIHEQTNCMLTAQYPVCFLSSCKCSAHLGHLLSDGPNGHHRSHRELALFRGFVLMAQQTHTTIQSNNQRNVFPNQQDQVLQPFHQPMGSRPLSRVPNSLLQLELVQIR
jgi:hypothetical protein